MADPKLDRIIDELFAGMPTNIALMRLLMEARSLDQLNDALNERRAVADSRAKARLDETQDLLRRQPEAFRIIRSVIREADHHGGGAGPDIWARTFDRLAKTAPEAAVALYALGSADLLSAATAEVVEWMRAQDLLGRDRKLVEIGCGIGRLTLALAPEMQAVLGTDVSSEMIAEARRRGRSCPNATFLRTSGFDIAPVEDGETDLVLASDVFPYLVEGPDDLARRHVAEAARILRPGGAFLILNYSYRGDEARDRSDAKIAFSSNGFELELGGIRPFRLWDAAAYLGRKPE